MQAGTTKDQLKELVSGLSGEEIAHLAECTRAGIWKSLSYDGRPATAASVWGSIVAAPLARRRRTSVVGVRVTLRCAAGSRCPALVHGIEPAIEPDAASRDSDDGHANRKTGGICLTPGLPAY